MSIIKKARSLIPAFAVLAPSIAFAATNQTLKDLVTSLSGYFNMAVELLMGLAVVFFVWNVVQYFIIKPDAERKEANQYIMWSIIGFFIILAFWGVVNILLATFNLGPNSHSWTDFANIFPQ